MSAATEPAQQGKSTQDGGKLSVGEATRTLTLPHLPYADAVLAELDDVGMAPAALEVGLRDAKPGSPVLFLRCVWPVDSPLLADGVRDRGLTLAWSHVTGWSAHNAVGGAELLNVDAIADPRLIGWAVLDLAKQDRDLRWSPPDRAAADRWSEAVYLDVALGLFDEKGGPSW